MTFEVGSASHNLRGSRHTALPMSECVRKKTIRVPELGIENADLKIGVWLVPLGARVAAGERVVEVLTGEAVVDLSAPIRGILVERLVGEEDPVQTGQILGWIEPSAAENHGQEGPDSLGFAS